MLYTEGSRSGTAQPAKRLVNRYICCIQARNAVCRNENTVNYNKQDGNCPLCSIDPPRTNRGLSRLSTHTLRRRSRSQSVRHDYIDCKEWGIYRRQQTGPWIASAEPIRPQKQLRIVTTLPKQQQTQLSTCMKVTWVELNEMQISMTTPR